MSVKVNIYNKQKKVQLPTGTKLLIRKACLATLVNEGIEQSALVDVTIVDDEEIKRVNSQFRNIDKSTDVLSFPLGENGVYDTDMKTGAIMLGDIMISAEHAVSQADLYGHGLEREIAFLTVHSMLHLLGYDHVNGGMEKTIIGRPNVGKSSLMNCIIGQKIAIVSDKPQTTRTRIMGVHTEGDNQIVFIDTPGFHKPKNVLVLCASGATSSMLAKAIAKGAKAHNLPIGA